MTGANADNVQVHPSTTAACLLLRLASPLFHAWADAEDGNREEAEYFRAWSTLRRAAEHLVSTRALPFPDDRLGAALLTAHNRHHLRQRVLGELVNAITSCSCPIAQTIREFEAVLKVANHDHNHDR
jgi:hypothetical protein